MPGGGSKPGERRGGRQRGTPNTTPTERAQALTAKVAKAEARANAKLVVEPLEHKLARDVLDWVWLLKIQNRSIWGKRPTIARHLALDGDFRPIPRQQLV